MKIGEERLQKKLKILLSIIAIACVTLSIAVVAVSTQTSFSTTTLYIDPPSIEDPTILPNDTIIIRVMINTVANMKKCDFNLTYNSSVLSVQRVTKFEIQGQYPYMNLDVDDIVGYLRANLSYKNTVTLATDTGLVEIEFFVKDYGVSPLHFASSTLTDNGGNPISHDTQDGFVHIFIRNIATKDIAVATNETYVGEVIPINVTVLNDGDITENFSVSLFYDSTLVATQDVVNLASKENLTLFFLWDTSGVPARLAPYTIKAEASILPHEINITDNTLTDGAIMLKIIGDVNGDGRVNIDDLIAWDAAYLSHSGDPNWNVQADLSMDGIVDKADATLILDHYMETV